MPTDHQKPARDRDAQSDTASAARPFCRHSRSLLVASFNPIPTAAIDAKPGALGGGRFAGRLRRCLRPNYMNLNSLWRLWVYRKERERDGEQHENNLLSVP